MSWFGAEESKNHALALEQARAARAARRNNHLVNREIRREERRDFNHARAIRLKAHGLIDEKAYVRDTNSR